MSNNDNASADEVLFEYTGKGCAVPKNVTSVRFHPSVVEVEEDAFRGRRQLKEVAFNDGLLKIGTEAFCLCTSLSSITFPSTLAEIIVNAFAHCNNLREVVLNDGLKKIGDWVFYHCRSLTIITLPSTVTEIGNRAFYGCRNLREIVFRGVPREIGSYAFSNCTVERFTYPTILSRLHTLIQTGHWPEIENEVNEVRGAVEWSGGELFVSAWSIDDELFVSTQTMGREDNNWNRVRDDLDNITRLISRYELKEATSIFELALWKFKLDQVDKANPIPRKKCRMDVPGPVKDIILQYLPCECLRPE